MAEKGKPGPLGSTINALAGRIAELRTRQGMTQHQLAEASGLALQYLTKIEQGDRSPSLKTLVALATALGLPIVELFNFEALEISSPRVELQLLELRRRLEGMSEEDAKLLNRLADRLTAGPVAVPIPRPRRT